MATHDQRTKYHNLPLPHPDNFLQDDEQRLEETINKLDEIVATVAADRKLDPAQLPDNAAKVDDKGILLPAQLPASVVTIDANQKIPVAQLPHEAVTNTFTASGDADMFASTSTLGDICNRLDLGKFFMLVKLPKNVLANWREIPGSVVNSINGKSGDVTNVAMLDIDPNTGNTSIANQAGPLVLKAKGTRGYEAVTFDQLTTIQAGTGSGASLSGVMTNFIGAVEWFNGNRTLLPAGHIAADGGYYSRAKYPDLWAAIDAGVLASVTDAQWLAGVTTGTGATAKTSTFANRGKYSTGGAAGTCPEKSITDAWFRVPDLNGIVQGSASGLFLRGSGSGPISVGTVAHSSLPDIQGTIGTNNGWMFTRGSGALRPYGTTSLVAPTTAPTTIATYAYLELKASNGSGIYGRDSQYLDATGTPQDWPASEVKPPQAVGIWIIRANGSFAAPGTAFSVIAGDAAAPATNTTVTGGVINSIYQIAGADAYKAQFYSDNRYGQSNKATIAAEDVQGGGNRGSLSVDNNGQATTAARTIPMGSAVGKLTAQMMSQIANADHPNLETCIFYAGDNSPAPSMGKPFNYWMGLNLAEGYHTGNAGNYFQQAFPMAVDAPPKFRIRSSLPTPRFSNWYSYLAQDTVTLTTKLAAYQGGWDEASQGRAALWLENVSNNTAGFVPALSWHSSSGANGSNYPIRATWGTISRGSSTWGDVTLRLRGDANYWTNYYFAYGGRLYGENVINGTLPDGQSGVAGWEFQKGAISDKTFKTDIKPFDGIKSLNNIDALELKTFRYTMEQMKPGVTRRGIIAQQAQKVDPEYVHEIKTSDGKSTLTLDSNVLLLDALAAIKVLSARVKELEAKLAS